MKSIPISNDVIEEEAIRIVRSLIPIEYCQEFIKKASTESSFDGYVNLFNDRNKSKKEGMIQIPVQVKGTTDDYDFDCFGVDVADLNNYSINGICFFVVKIKYNDEFTDIASYRALCRCFVGLEILDLLKGKEDQIKIRLSLNEVFTKEDIKALFVAYKTKHQTVTAHNYIDPTRFNSGKVSFLGEDNRFALIPELGKTYFATFESDGITAFAHNFKIDSEALVVEDKIVVNGKTYFNRYEKQIDDKNNFYIRFNDALSFQLFDNKMKIILNKYSSVDDYIDALSFLYDAASFGSFSIGNLTTPFYNKKSIVERMKEGYLNLLFFAKTIRGVIRSVGYEKKFSLMDLNQNDVNLIASLYTNRVNNSVDYCLLDISLFTKMIARVIGNDQILFLNFFDNNLYWAVKFKRGNDITKRTTPFIYLTVEQWQKMDLEQTPVFADIIKKYVVNDNEVTSDYRMVVGKLLRAYVNSGRDRLLEYASFLNEHFNFSYNLNRLLEDLK